MTTPLSPARPLGLELVGVPTPPVDNIDTGAGGAAPVARPEDSVAAHGVDAWLVGATREYQSGWIDQSLWVRCLAQSGGDEAKAKVAYLRTRAMALQVAKRGKRSETSARRVHADAESAPPAASPATGGTSLERAKTTPGSRLRMATVLGSMLMIAGIGVIVINRETVAEPRPSIASAERRLDPGTSARAGHARPSVSANASGTTKPEGEEEGFETKIAKLIDAGNWNVLVLYASEWTRKEPANVNAWIQLSMGYAALRQLGDALESATKAAQLAPDNPRVWRNLGRVNTALDQPAEALHAFEQAVALDDHDAQSLVQVGLLNAQLGRLPQARVAFDKALNTSPDDVGALCGQLTVARQQGRPQDADVVASKLQSLGRPCRDANESVSVAVVANRSAPYKAKPSSPR